MSTPKSVPKQSKNAQREEDHFTMRIKGAAHASYLRCVLGSMHRISLLQPLSISTNTPTYSFCRTKPSKSHDCNPLPPAFRQYDQSSHENAQTPAS